MPDRVDAKAIWPAPPPWGVAEGVKVEVGACVITVTGEVEVTGTAVLGGAAVNEGAMVAVPVGSLAMILVGGGEGVVGF